MASSGDSETTFDYHSLWISRSIDCVSDVVGSPVLASSMLFGVPPTTIVVAYITLRWDHFSIGYFSSLLFIILVLFVTPYLAWYYDNQLLPTFCDRFTEIAENSDRIHHIARQHQRFYVTWWGLAALLASFPIPLLLWAGKPFLTAQGLFGASDPLFWLVAIVLLWLGMITGIGFLFVLTTMLVVREVVSDKLQIDPLHPDGLGGLSIVGYYSIRTTGLFSLGALLIPLQFQYAAVVGDFATWLIYVMGSLYAVFIAASFLYPTLKVNRRADEIRNDILEDLRIQHREIKRHAGEPEVGANLTDYDTGLEMKLQRVRREYDDYKQVRLYPMEGTVFIRLIGSVMLPLVFILIDTLLRPEVVSELISAVAKLIVS